MEGLAKVLVVTISQYISVSNQHIVHVKLTHCYICQVYLNKAWKKYFVPQDNVSSLSLPYYLSPQTSSGNHFEFRLKFLLEFQF